MGNELTFFEHLDELRKRIIVALVAVSFGTLLSYTYSDRLLQILIRPMELGQNHVYFFSPAEACIVKLKVALFTGLFLASPVVLNQTWIFISPAFHKREKKAVSVVTLIASFFFLSGIVFCFYAVIPPAIRFLMGLQTDFLKPMISVTDYLDFLFGMLLAFGVAFNLPVFVMALALIGVLNPRTLNHYHKHAIVLIFILAALLTPSPDIASQILLAAPLLALFEISVLGVFWVERRRRVKSLMPKVSA